MLQFRHRILALSFLAFAPLLPAQDPMSAPPTQAVVPGGSANPLVAEPIGLADMIRAPQSELATAVQRWAMDRERLQRLYPFDASPAALARMEQFHRAWLAELQSLPWKSLSRAAQVDALCLRTWIERSLGELEQERSNAARLATLVDFDGDILELVEAKVRIEAMDARAAAERLDRTCRTIAARRIVWEQHLEDGRIERFDASRAAKRIDEYLRALRVWFDFYDGYDPQFSWWCREPYQETRQALEGAAKFLRERVVRVGSGENDIVGDPIGSQALARALAEEWIPYTAEELVVLAEREFAWCEEQLRIAAREMGCGEDTKLALERVKQSSVAPGEQPALIRDMTLEAIAFLRAKDLISVPSLAAETWRMNMLSPQSQRQNPFFLGGDAISVSYPTSGMSHEEKLMSMRGNNPHFSRAVVHHEVIPGHNLQGFMGERSNPHRRNFSTPFWTEGWALYWELLLWNKGFAASPEDRVGMLFWRMHRCARIVFSLKFHLGEMTPAQCIDFLEQRVGHERANAAAEVRRSFAGDYGPLYQIGYLLGGMQFMALHDELCGTDKWTEKRFHDAVIRANSLPVELVRALLSDEPLTPDRRTTWRFAD
jgi:uncharacterized protein (DUF885 family)